MMKAYSNFQKSDYALSPKKLCLQTNLLRDAGDNFGIPNLCWIFEVKNIYITTVNFHVEIGFLAQKCPIYYLQQKKLNSSWLFGTIFEVVNKPERPLHSCDARALKVSKVYWEVLAVPWSSKLAP